MNSNHAPKKSRKWPCPVYLPGMSKTQKRYVRGLWGIFLDDWLLEQDPLYVSNMQSARRRLDDGLMTDEAFQRVRSTLKERSLRRGYATLNRPQVNAAIGEWWAMKHQPEEIQS